MNGEYLGGQLAYMQKGVIGIFVHDDMGNAVRLNPEAQFNWIEHALDGVVIKIAKEEGNYH